MPVCGRGQTGKFSRVLTSLLKKFARKPSKCSRLPVVILSGDKHRFGGVRYGEYSQDGAKALVC